MQKLNFDPTENPRYEIHHYSLVNADIPCDKPDAHKEWHRELLGCIVCKDMWQKSLPFGYSSRNVDGNAALLVFLKVPKNIRNSPRHSQIIKDFWSDKGEQWKGYTCEEFGIELGELDDSAFYPFPLLDLEYKPKLLVRLLRLRICYEPQKIDYPLFLEVKFIGFNHYEISIEGLDWDLDIAAADLLPLMRAREFLFSQEKFSLLNLKSQNLLKKVTMFSEAAMILGRKRRTFTIPNLCKECANYKSRNSYYSFINAIANQEGKEKAQKVEAFIREQYEAGRTQPKLTEKKSLLKHKACTGVQTVQVYKKPTRF